MLFRKSVVMSYVYGENLVLQNWVMGKGGLQAFTDAKALTCSDFMILPSDPSSFCAMRILKTIYLCKIWKEALNRFELEHKKSAYFRNEVLPKVKNALFNYALSAGTGGFSETVLGWDGMVKALEVDYTRDSSLNFNVTVKQNPYGSIFDMKAVISNIGLCDERFCANIALKHAKDFKDFLRIMDMHGATRNHVTMPWTESIKMMKDCFLSTEWTTENIFPHFKLVFSGALDSLKDQKEWYNAAIDTFLGNADFKQFNLATIRS